MTTKKKMTFEQALTRLEEIVGQLESGEISLEDSIKSFEEGKELVKLCLSKLEQAEKKIQQLEARTDGSFEVS